MWQRFQQVGFSIFSKALLFLGVTLFSLNVPAFLNDNDPNNFFDLVEQAPQVMVGQVTQVKVPEPGKSYFLIQLKIDGVLSGEESSKNITVFQEQVFPKELPPGKVGQKLLVLLAPLPKYTAYQPAWDQGARYRFFGAASGVWDLNRFPELSQHAQNILKAKTGGKVAVEKRKDLLLALLTSGAVEVQNSGALGLGATPLSKGALTQEEETQIYQALEPAKLSSAGQRALIEALKKSQSIPVLERIADQMSGVSKWAAVRALEDLGHPRNTASLLEDYRKGDSAEKTRALSQIVRKPDAPATDFLRQMLGGSEEYSLKREAIIKMGEVGGKRNEIVLMEQVREGGAGEELVSAQALLALGKLSSAPAAQSAIKMLDSPSKVLRDAAILSLYLNQDPTAARYMQERFVKDDHGHFYPRRRHQSEIPGAAPEGNGHSH